MADVMYTVEELKQLEDMTDWERVLSMKDEDIVFDEDCPPMEELIKQGRLHFIGRGSPNDPRMRELARKVRDEVRAAQAAKREAEQAAELAAKQK